MQNKPLNVNANQKIDTDRLIRYYCGMYKAFNLFLAFLSGVFLISFQACKPDPVGPCSQTLTPYELDIPQGFPQMVVPKNNPMTVQGVELGRKLFYDVRLSGDNTQACATCHFSTASYADSAQFSTGITGAIGDRNAMAVVNVGYSFSLFWDGRAATLEEQALAPVTNPVEMNATWPDVLTKLNADSYYRDEFKFVYGVNVIDSFDVARALAQFERTMISGNSKYDKYLRGELILSDEEFRGLSIFMTEKGDCFHCHGTVLTMGYDYENNGLQNVMTDFGRGDITNYATDIGKFKPPTLRNIELTAPFMHNGSLATLEEVVEFYNSGVNQSSPNISPLMLKANRPGGSLNLTATEKSDLVVFLKTLTDMDFINNPAFQSE